MWIDAPAHTQTTHATSTTTTKTDKMRTAVNATNENTKSVAAAWNESDDNAD